MNSIKLHLACGEEYKEGYINVDLYPSSTIRVDQSFDIKQIPYADNSVDEIVALHVIEHFDFFEGQVALKEWYRVLKPGGKLLVETPDFLETCDAFVKGSEEYRVALYSHFFAHPWISGQTHKFLFTESQLKGQIEWAGFKSVFRIYPVSRYLTKDNHKLLLAMEAYK